MLKGLQYVGNGRGISVMLYKSYKSVDVTWDKPYAFTSKDIVNDDAKKYYSRNYSPLGIRLIEDNTILPELDAKVETKVEEAVKAVEIEVEEIEEEEVKVEEAVEESTTEVVENPKNESSKMLMDIFKSIKSEYGEEIIASISESDLSSLLDEKLDDDQAKELASLVGYSVGRAKNKYKIISGLASSHLDAVVNLILA